MIQELENRMEVWNENIKDIKEKNSEIKEQTNSNEQHSN